METNKKPKITELLIKVNWRNLFLELLVVFIGVYGAFSLESYRTNQIQLKEKITYLNAFELILNRYLDQGATLKSKVDNLIKNHEDGVPISEEKINELDFTNTIYIVESVFSSDRFPNVHSEFMMNLESGANLLKMLESRLIEFRERVYHAQLNNKEESEVFKDWYYNELKFLSSRLNRLKGMIEQGAMPETQEIIRKLQQKG